MKKFSEVYTNVQKEQVWKVWADVESWPKWDKQLQYCTMQEAFSQGSQFILKPVGGPKVKIMLSEIVCNEKFTDYCKFFGATMMNTHELVKELNGLRITHTVTVTGPLTYVWVKLIAKNVANSIPIQTNNLVNYTRSINA